MGRGLKFALFAILISTFLSGYSQRLASHPFSRDDSAKVTEYMEKVESNMQRGDSKTASDWLNRAALVYWNHNFFEKAAQYYGQSLNINKELGNENGIAMINSNLGMIYHDLGQYEKAVEYFTATLAARRAKNEKVSIISALNNLSVSLNHLKRFDESISFLEEALVLARELNDMEQMKNCYGNLSEAHEKAGNNKQSHHFFELYRTFHEELQEEEIGKVRAEMENQKLKSELERKEKELEILKKNKIIEVADSTNRRLNRNLTKREMEVRMLSQEAKIKDLEAERQQQQIEKGKRTQRNIFLAALVLAVLLIGSAIAIRQIRRANKKLAEQNKLIREQQHKILGQKQSLETANEAIKVKNQEITASINYASIIQSAMLFQEEHLSDLIPESFILFLPKDIVSGDFYWYKKVGERIVISAVDCTGHGVPGGFMSMIANNLLVNIVTQHKELSPKAILEQLDDGVQLTLNQSLSGNRSGMDMALCSIDIARKKLYFAGAKNPLLLIKDGEIILIKGSRFSVGGSMKRKKEYEEHEIDLGKENHIYMYSDGFQDQFGGPDNRKYSNKPFRELLVENHKLPAKAQHTRLLDELETWKGDNKQIDDVLVIGAKILT